MNNETMEKQAVIGNEDKANILTEQYKCRTQLLTEILKMYFHLLLVFAIALFACINALTRLEGKEISVIQDIIGYAYMLSPFVILSWMAGYLFLYWNYESVITEMDSIAKELESFIGNLKSSLLSHNHFLKSYTGIRFVGMKIFKSIYVLYILIALPVLFSYAYFGYLGFEKCMAKHPSVASLYLFGLIFGPIFCLSVHLRFVFKNKSRIQEFIGQ
jgi:hypothetical protein